MKTYEEIEKMIDLIANEGVEAIKSGNDEKLNNVRARISCLTWVIEE